ncbi:MAG TPA: CYCXC family (seleno)protein [Pyrinomonadaceae bacterium]|nr:CYCXC family (seleno)protein [Pyrinomonadaceae bacterium]
MLTLSRNPAKPVQTASGQQNSLATSSPQEQRENIPKYYETAPTNLPSTLPPEKFPGKTREAYQAAKEIPQTLAQLPCYCHCDRGMGHKSLHSCFEDDHAAHCATCTDEALLAYRLQKEEYLSAKQIRERIIASYPD